MIDLKILAVKTSWSYVMRDAEEAGTLFYRKLFQLDPSLRLLFKHDIDAQAGKLTDMVTYIIARLQRMDDIERVITALAARHVQYGTRPEHYRTVGEALLSTLETVLGDRWDKDTRAAWTDVYGLVATTMINAENGLESVPEN
ncbi:MAG: hemin receptor [Cytophagales bacterium]|nr:hemin receptor [Cytophagales bacterium]